MEYKGLIADHVTPKATEGDTCFTLTGTFSNGAGVNCPVLEENAHYTVRRLTPKEGLRLQGFPDDWLDIPDTIVNGRLVKPSDGAKFKAIGNSIALPQWHFIIENMAEYLGERPALGSLFDGIGGFPLVWETKHGKGTAKWASEIEPFPIAVTMNHFPEGEENEE